jgi:hypothetical protein
MYRNISLVLAVLISVILGGCAGVRSVEEVKPIEIQVLESGLYQNNARVTKVIGPERDRLILSDPGKMIEVNSIYKPVLGQSVGFYYILRNPYIRGKMLTMVVKYPDGGIYDERKDKQVYSVEINRKINGSDLYGHMFNFTYSWELVSGTYTLEIMDGSNVIASRDYVVDASE